ncbi:unnamed protein product [Chondrus crispus]|uniref:Uncharacterized protein n=1 Tax=Chondrus crispus TaxID=2769 RepID=R7QNS7_CHOCR|nr:unnamed protein product [Chondrus crispus]CDF39759.1 unnamed protein product [Chondrus crispus]|eukprot:XP_005710053.1 unnamed protein product [Chondrus crispus]
MLTGETTRFYICDSTRKSAVLNKRTVTRQQISVG